MSRKASLSLPQNITLNPNHADGNTLRQMVLGEMLTITPRFSSWQPTITVGMGVSRSGYYKWKRRGSSDTDEHRQYMIELVRSTHEKHRTHGYRWTAAYIRINEKVNISDGYAYKCFRFLGIKAETLHRVKYRPRKERDKYPNLVYSTCETVDRPRQVIVSDMTMIKGPFFLFEVTFYFDVFTKEMLTFQVGLRRGDRTQYIEGLIDIIKILRFQGFETEEPTILHTDQGSVYSSLAYNDLIKDENIVRSMSRTVTTF